MQATDQSSTIQRMIKEAVAERRPLDIMAGGSKAFYGRKRQGRALPVAQHRGVLNYQPAELVITARAGTPLREIEQVLAEKNQMLAFEPPFFAGQATLGGTIACGLSGSRRPFAGSARDFVLGCRIIDGNGDILSFGGEVMKNVAGYDVSRLMTGAMGTLGVLLEISLKVLPLPQQEVTRSFILNEPEARAKMQQMVLQGLPLSGLSYDGECLYARFSGAEKALRVAMQKLGGDSVPEARRYWRDLNAQQLSFFQSETPLWRLSLPPATAKPALSGQWYQDWAGALRWLKSSEPPGKIFAAAAAANGHATLFRGGDRSGHVFQPLSGQLQQLQRRLKQAFDPYGVFNPQRMYRDW